MNVSRHAINRPVTTTMIYLAVAFLGIIAFLRLPVDLLPDISFPTLSVTTNYSGAGPREVEREVTILLENVLSTVPGVTQISSSSTEGRSSISLRFNWGTDLDAAANEVRPAIDRARNRLPTGAEIPRVAKFDPNLFPIVLLGIESRGDLSALRDLAEKEFKPRFEQIDGVAAVDVRGARAREIHVDLNRQRLEALGISDREVTQALKSESVSEPGGDVRVGAERRVVRTVGRFASVDEITQTVVATRQGVAVRVADVATVEDAVADATSIVRINGRPALLIAISKQSGTNTVAVAQRIFKVAGELGEQFPQAPLVTVNDGSLFIRRSINNLRSAAALGAVLTVLVLLVFLRNVSSTLIISTAIPVSILATVLLMFWSGFTLNLMTFGGLALAVGMLVDSAIVVLENIFRHREEGRPPRLAAEEATNRGHGQHPDHDRRLPADVLHDRDRQRDVPAAGLRGNLRPDVLAARCPDADPDVRGAGVNHDPWHRSGRPRGKRRGARSGRGRRRLPPAPGAGDARAVLRGRGGRGVDVHRLEGAAADRP